MPWRWVITWQFKDDKWVTKARCTLKGFVEEGIGLETFSPTANRASLKRVVLEAAFYGWTLEALYMKAAFLDGVHFQRARGRWHEAASLPFRPRRRALEPVWVRGTGFLTQAIKFYNHEDKIVRTSVQNIVLQILKSKLIPSELTCLTDRTLCFLDKDPKVNKFFSRFPFVLYFVHLSCYINDLT